MQDCRPLIFDLAKTKMQTWFLALSIVLRPYYVWERAFLGGARHSDLKGPLDHRDPPYGFVPSVFITASSITN
jgi:hypothetical protein